MASYLTAIPESEHNGNMQVVLFDKRGVGMTYIHQVHAALFDELERQGIHAVDVGRLTHAVVKAQESIGAQGGPAASPSRCVNGACDE